MNKNSYFQPVLLMTLVTTIILFGSCNSRQKSQDTIDVAQDRNEERFDDNRLRNDAQFLVNAAEINLRQIQLGQLAKQRGTKTHIKELGKMMEDAHAKSQRDLTILARSKSITIPTSTTDDARDAFENLNRKSGDAFDKEYVEMMVSNNKDAIDTFEKASTDNHDSDIKNWATTTLYDLRKHLDHSIDCQQKTNDMAVRNR